MSRKIRLTPVEFDKGVTTYSIVDRDGTCLGYVSQYKLRFRKTEYHLKMKSDSMISNSQRVYYSKRKLINAILLHIHYQFPQSNR